jgi:hypothetical protein
MTRQIKRRTRKKKKLLRFRSQLIKLYEEFKTKTEKLSEEYEVEINYWYSPSRIPQPKFIFGNVGISADTLYREEEFNLIYSPNSTLNKKNAS